MNGIEQEHCHSCGTKEGEFEARDVKGLPMTLCSDCRDTLDAQAGQNYERRLPKKDRRQIGNRRSSGYRYRKAGWSDRRQGERRRGNA